MTSKQVFSVTDTNGIPGNGMNGLPRDGTDLGPRRPDYYGWDSK